MHLARARVPAGLVLVLTLAACAQGGDGRSARKPFASLDTGNAPSATAPPGNSGFRIARTVDWAASLNARRVPVSTPALEGGRLGPFPAAAFRLVTGTCADCGTPAAALWYFRRDVVAVPQERAPTIRSVLPPLVWIAAPEIVEDARLARDGSALIASGTRLALAIPPRLPTNTAYVDASTLRFLAEHPVLARGATRIENGEREFVARTLWPTDTRIDVEGLELRPLRRNETLGTLIEAQGGGTAPIRFPARLLFESRDETRDWREKPAIGVVLSGAQGDDDGSRAGHLAVATGRLGSRGEWHDWLVDDFYPLDVPSPKGILSAAVPMDNYLFDFNGGQLYYRPAYMLVVVLERPRIAASVQEALQRMMLSYYCRAFEFNLASRNSTALSIDPLRALGWRIPTTGPTSLAGALIAGPLAALAQWKLSSGEDVYSALTQEKTRLLPRVAFEVLGHDLLYLLGNRGRANEADLTPFERRLTEDVTAVLFVRLPQVPSARREGTFPERSLLVYGARLLASPHRYESQPKNAPVAFPAGLEASCTATLDDGGSPPEAP